MLPLTYYLINLGVKSGIRIFFFFLITAFPILSWAQDKSIVITLKLRDGKDATLNGGKAHYDGGIVPMSNVLVSVYDKAGNVLVQKQTTGADGNVTFKLEAFKEYTITTFLKGYVSEHVWVDASVKGKENKASFKIETEQIILLFDPTSDKLKAELLGKPFTKIIYSGNEFTNDNQYENAVKAEAGRLSAQARKDAYSRLQNGDLFPGTATGGTGTTPTTTSTVTPTGADADKLYKAQLAKADKSFKDNDYNKAKDYYDQCLTLKPDESYPRDQIAKIIRVYKDAIYKADQLSLNKEYERARDLYKDALACSPHEQYPKDQIKEMNRLLNQADASGDYASLIANGDKSYKEKSLIHALTSYNAALKQKPGDKYAKDQVAKVNAEIKKNPALSKAFEKQYNDAMKAGRDALDSKDFETARASYTEASNLKPESKVPVSQLAKIDGLMKAAQKETDEKYAAAIALADQALGQKQLDKARTSYSDALTLKPAESYPKDKLAEIDKLLAAAAAGGDSYQTAIAKGDQAFNEKDYKNAKTDYTEALSIKPGEKYPTDRLAEIDKLLKEMESKIHAIEALGPNHRDEVNNAQIFSQLQERHDELVERSNQLKMLKRLYVKRMANLSTKYDTENPLTRLLDIVDTKK